MRLTSTVIYILFFIFLIVAGGLILKYQSETFIAPWDLEDCRLACFQAGQQVPWEGGADGAWNDPANFRSSNFDVAGCMERCDMNTWYNPATGKSL